MQKTRCFPSPKQVPATQWSWQLLQTWSWSPLVANPQRWPKGRVVEEKRVVKIKDSSVTFVLLPVQQWSFELVLIPDETGMNQPRSRGFIEEVEPRLLRSATARLRHCRGTAEALQRYVFAVLRSADVHPTATVWKLPKFLRCQWDIGQMRWESCSMCFHS